jgi:DHA2 family methylenomycin A resistance protein-like MFS transporter
VATVLTFVPMTGLTAFVILLAPRAAARFGPRVPIALGQFLIVVGLLGLCVGVVGAPVLLLSLLTIPVGFGSALAIPTITALLVGSVPAARAGTASGGVHWLR